MVRLKLSFIQDKGNLDSVPLGRWSLEDGSVKTTESSSMTSSLSLSAITENGFFSACFAFCAASLSFCACSLFYCCRLSSFCCFLSLSFSSFLFFSSSFFIVLRVACLRAGPG